MDFQRLKKQSVSKDKRSDELEIREIFVAGQRHGYRSRSAYDTPKNSFVKSDSDKKQIDIEKEALNAIYRDLKIGAPFNELDSTKIVLDNRRTLSPTEQKEHWLSEDLRVKKHASSSDKFNKEFNQEKEDKFTLEMEFGRLDLPFNIRVEHARGLGGGVTASINNNESASSQYAYKKEVSNNITKMNEPDLTENPFGVNVEVVPLDAERDFLENLDKSKFKEEFVRKILEDDNKIRQPPDEKKTTSKNQARPVVFVRDVPVKNIGNDKGVSNEEIVLDHDFTRTKTNDVLQSWVQEMEKYIEDQKMELKRKMLSNENNFWGNEKHLPSSDKSSSYEVFKSFSDDKSLADLHRMTSRNDPYHTFKTRKVQESDNLPSGETKRKSSEAGKKPGIIKSEKKKILPDRVSFKKLDPAAKESRKSMKKTEKQTKKPFGVGPKIAESNGPIFKPPPLAVQKPKKSFVITPKKPILRSSHTFGLVRKLPLQPSKL